MDFDDFNQMLEKENPIEYQMYHLVFGPYPKSFLKELHCHRLKRIEREIAYEYSKGNNDNKLSSVYSLCCIEHDKLAVYLNFDLDRTFITDLINSIMQQWYKDQISMDCNCISYPDKNSSLKVCLKPGFEIDEDVIQSSRSYYIYLDKRVLQLTKNQNFDIHEEIISIMSNVSYLRPEAFRLIKLRSKKQFPHLWGKVIIKKSHINFPWKIMTDSWFAISSILLEDEQKVMGNYVDVEIIQNNLEYNKFIISYDGREKDWSQGLIVNNIVCSIAKLDDRNLQLSLNNKRDFEKMTPDDVKKEFFLQYDANIGRVERVCRNNSNFSIREVCSLFETLKTLPRIDKQNFSFALKEIDNESTIIKSRLYINDFESFVKFFQERDILFERYIVLSKNSFQIRVGKKIHSHLFLSYTEYRCLKSVLIYLSEVFKLDLCKKNIYTSKKFEIKLTIENPFHVFIIDHIHEYIEELKTILNAGKYSFDFDYPPQDDLKFSNLGEINIKTLTAIAFEIICQNNFKWELDEWLLGISYRDLSCIEFDICSKDFEESEDFFAILLKKLYLRCLYEEISHFRSSDNPCEASLLLRLLERIRHNYISNKENQNLCVMSNYVESDLKKDLEDCDLKILKQLFELTIIDTNEKKHKAQHIKNLNLLFVEYGFHELAPKFCSIEYQFKGSKLKNFSTQTDLYEDNNHQAIFLEALETDLSFNSTSTAPKNDKCVQVFSFGSSTNLKVEFPNEDKKKWLEFSLRESIFKEFAKFLVIQTLEYAPSIVYLKYLTVPFSSSKGNVKEIIDTVKKDWNDLEVTWKPGQLVLVSASKDTLFKASISIRKLLENGKKCCLCFETEISENSFELT